MSFLKTLFWVIFLVGFTVFAINNWQPVSMKLWNGLWLDSKLPAVIGASFLLGFFPLWIWHRSVRYRLNRRIATLETSARPLAPSSAAQPTTAKERAL
jgi:lipopolysaccharide assembly protein A